MPPLLPHELLLLLLPVLALHSTCLIALRSLQIVLRRRGQTWLILLRGMMTATGVISHGLLGRERLGLLHQALRVLV